MADKGRYNRAVICANGHVVNDQAQEAPERSSRFCRECGEGTLSECPECGEPIRGRYNDLPLAPRAVTASTGQAVTVPPSHASPPAEARIPHPAGAGAAAPVAPAPNFYHECGEPYPWTRDRLDASRQLADEVKGLSAEERVQLKECFPDLLSNNPRSEVAALRVRRLLGKAGGEALEALRALLVDLASETAKRIIFS